MEGLSSRYQLIGSGKYRWGRGFSFVSSTLLPLRVAYAYSSIYSTFGKARFRSERPLPSCPLHAFASLRPMFPIKLFSLFRGERYFSGLPRIPFRPVATIARSMWLDRTGKGPITCQYRHYWRTERNINVYDPMRAHPNPCPSLYTPRVRSTVFPTVALKFSSPTNLHFSDSSTPLPPSPKYTPLGSR